MKSRKPQPMKFLLATLAVGVVILPASLRAAEYIAYDASGNIVAHRVDSKAVSMAYDDGNRLVELAEPGRSAEFSYDASGAMVGETREGADIAYEYRYGSRLSRRVENGESVEVFYDHRGYPVAKRSRGEVTPWLWEGSRMVAIGDEPQRPELANVDFLGTDLGRSGSLYGGADSGVYTGKHFDEDLQAYVFPYRFYRPDLLRWTTPDPIGYPDGWNAFAYVGDPIAFRDPLGLEPEYVHDFGQFNIKPSAAEGNGGVAKILSFFAPGSPTLHLKAKYGENLDPNTSINHPTQVDAVPGGLSSGQTSGTVINFNGQIAYSYRTGPIPTLEGSMRKEKQVEEEDHYYTPPH